MTHVRFSAGYDRTAQRIVECDGIPHQPRNDLQPRRFERGFSADFFNLQPFCLKHGYDLVYIKRAYQLRKRDGGGRSKSMTWQQVLAEIDRVIRVPLGLEPIIRRAA